MFTTFLKSAVLAKMEKLLLFFGEISVVGNFNFCIFGVQVYLFLHFFLSFRSEFMPYGL